MQITIPEPNLLLPFYFGGRFRCDANWIPESSDRAEILAFEPNIERRNGSVAFDRTGCPASALCQRDRDFWSHFCMSTNYPKHSKTTFSLCYNHLVRLVGLGNKTTGDFFITGPDRSSLDKVIHEQLR